MYNPKKYTYTTLPRQEIEGSRKYLTPDGDKLPSVTTILEATQTEKKKKSLFEWKKRVGFEKAKEISSTASGRGTRMHKFLEDYVKTGQISQPGTNPFSIQGHGMATRIIERGLSKCNEIWGTEISLYYPQIYAGTTDLVGIHDGSEAIMDFKQSNKVKKKEWIDDYFLQLVAYSNAHNVMYGTSINKGVIFMCTPECVYQEFIIEGNEFRYWSDEWFKRLEEYYRQYL